MKKKKKKKMMMKTLLLRVTSLISLVKSMAEFVLKRRRVVVCAVFLFIYGMLMFSVVHSVCGVFGFMCLSFMKIICCDWMLRLMLMLDV